MLISGVVASSTNSVNGGNGVFISEFGWTDFFWIWRVQNLIFLWACFHRTAGFSVTSTRRKKWKSAWCFDTPVQLQPYINSSNLRNNEKGGLLLPLLQEWWSSRVIYRFLAHVFPLESTLRSRVSVPQWTWLANIVRSKVTLAIRWMPE